MYKVTKNHQPSPSHNNDDFLLADKGDILINGRFLDADWFYAKNTMTEKEGMIPRDHVVLFAGSDEGEHDYGEVGVQGDGVVGDEERTHKTYSDDDEDDDNSSDDDDSETPTSSSQGSLIEPSSDAHLNHVISNAQSNVNNVKPPDDVIFVGDVVDTKEKQGDDDVSDERFDVVAPLPDHVIKNGGDNNDIVDSLPSNKTNVKMDDEVQYDIPEISPSKPLLRREKKKLFRNIFRLSMLDSPKPVVPHPHKTDEMTEKYYNPPADVRDHYFLPYTANPIIRILLSLVAALAVSFTALFTLSISLNILLSFSIALVLFLVIFIAPVTLARHSFLCVMALVVPSMFSTRTKCACVVLLTLLIVVGPIVGIVNKLHMAKQCYTSHTMSDGVRTDVGVISRPGVGDLSPQARFCVSSFETLRQSCIGVYEDFQNDCKTRGLASTEKVCRKNITEFCFHNATYASGCVDYSPRVSVKAENIRRTLSHLLPILLLFVFADAYYYNRVYLTMKDEDNVYITQRLKQMDGERKERGLTDLILPLTRIEFQTYLLRGRLTLSKCELVSAVKWLLVLLLFSVLSYCIIAAEDYIKDVLMTSQFVPCVKLFDVTSSEHYRVFIHFVRGFLFFVIVLQSYALRLRSKVCDYFYPDMVDVRAKHLYYKILHDRLSFARHIHRKIQLHAEAKRLTRRVSCLSMIYLVLPHMLQWLCRKLSVRMCMVCDSITYRKTVICAHKGCQAHYCYECYVDATHQCITCRTRTPPPMEGEGKGDDEGVLPPPEGRLV